MKNKYWYIRSYIEKETTYIIYKDVYFFKDNNVFLKEEKDHSLLFNLSYKKYFFHCINEFIKINGLVRNNFLNIIFNYYKTLFNIFFFKKDYNYYYYLIRLVYVKYNDLYIENSSLVVRTTNNIYNYMNLRKTGLRFFKLYELKKVENLFLKNWYDSVKNLFHLNDKYFAPIYEYEFENFGENSFLINFIRVQRRYNKRRYSKVRSWSRPPFVAGISLSSIFLAMFWIGTVKSVDWNNIFIIVININNALFIIYSYLYYRMLRLKLLKNSIRKKNKIKIINNLHKVFFFNWIINDRK